ncbi:hypothetical protein QOZ80_3BG0266740 [Eleusine coracana subsp. coracana]|nr:hypothetical protein QOZ80_3BG0266740 [Eleusine coracana subsp. coracana]
MAALPSRTTHSPASSPGFPRPTSYAAPPRAGAGAASWPRRPRSSPGPCLPTSHTGAAPSWGCSTRRRIPALPPLESGSAPPPPRLLIMVIVGDRAVPTESRLLLPGFPRTPSIGGHADAALLEYSRPVAARNGRMVLELRRERHADGLELCVFDPVTGDAALLPPLTGTDKPGSFACALLTGDDLPQLNSFFFRVLIIYNRGTFTALRAYSSDTDRWNAQAARPNNKPKIDAERLRKLGQGVVVRGVAFWPLRRSVLAVRLGVDGPPEPRELASPPDGILSDLPLEHRLLGVTADGELSFTDARLGFQDRALGKQGLPSHCVVLATKVLRRRPAAATSCTVHDDVSASEWEQHGCIVLPQIKVRTCKDTVNLRWFCERSGVILFTVGENSSSPGAYALNVRMQEVARLAVDGGDSWRNVVGYEMDAAACLASIARY